ncbi:MAG: alpha/beta hydrolase [Prolixibacteraceae bacterium]|nr:alpha/beta hydrolase [Prolixibacteraceae bacterium]
MRYLILILLLFPVCLFAQIEEQDFPKDTSFTVFSAFQKIKKDFPDAKPVKPFHSEKILSVYDKVYRKTGNRNLHMDIFYPANYKKKLPAVLLIHGGGWRSGNKSHMVPLAQKLAEKGYVTAAVEYRLSAEAVYPAGIYDLKEAVKFLKFTSNDLPVDSSKIITLGCSSGATLATFLGTTGNIKKFDPPETQFPGISSSVSYIINIDGIVDFTDPAESGKDNDPEKPSAGAWWFGGTFKEVPEKWIEASPVNYAGKNTPPILFINSSLPRYHAGRDKLLEKIKSYGIYSEIHTINNTPHPFWLFYPWFNETEKYITDFLEKVVK